MSETFGPDFITVTDEDGNEFELELVDTLEHNGITYHALFPAVAEDEETGRADSSRFVSRPTRRPASPWMWTQTMRNTVWSS